MTPLGALVDPDELLNPGVLLNDDPDGHIRDLKTTPTVEVEVELAWVNHRNPLQREVGLAFTAMTDQARALLEPFFQAAMHQSGREAA